MRLLIINYELNTDSNVLAWQASVVRELAGHCEKVVVLTEQIGQFESIQNVFVHLIPRRPWGIPKVLGSRWLVNFMVAQLIRKHGIEVCFIHMAMDWTYLLAPALKLLKIPVLLWYAHGTVTHRLRLAHACATKIVTSTPEGFRLPSRKIIVIGQGINTNLFKIPKYLQARNDILYVGRISPRKRVLQLIKAISSLIKTAPESPIRLRIIGPVLSEQDRNYLDEILSEIDRSGLNDRVEILGDMPQRDIPPYYQTTFLHLNLSQTGSMDKTVMEALACGCPVLTSNEAFYNMLDEYPEFLLSPGQFDDIVEKIIYLHQNQRRYDPNNLRAMIIGHHDMYVYAHKIYDLSVAMATGRVEYPNAQY